VSGRPPQGAITGHFGRGVERYDRVLARNGLGARRLVESTPAASYTTVLDVGCGTGLAAEWMVRRRGARRVVGVDPSPEMRTAFLARMSRLDVEADARPGHAAAMDVPDSGFDAVVSSFAAHWFPDLDAGVAGLSRACAPGGIVAVVAPARGTDRQTYAALRAAGRPIRKPPSRSGPRRKRLRAGAAGRMYAFRRAC